MNRPLWGALGFASALVLQLGIAPAQSPRNLTAEQRSQLAEAEISMAQGVELRGQKKQREALPFEQQALATIRRILGDDDLAVATALNNVAVLLDELADFSAARDHQEQALKIRRKLLGVEHLDTAASISHLGQLATSQGDYKAAREYLEEALGLRRKLLGENSSVTAISHNNLASLLQLQGEYGGARSHLEQALKIKKRTLGEEHASTITSLNNLATVLSAMGDYAAARQYFEQALQISRRTLGNKHRDLVPLLNNLGFLHFSNGDYLQARRFLDEAIQVQRALVGAEHPEIARLLDNVGHVLQSQNEHALARQYFDQALVIYKKSLGEEHPTTALLLRSIGNLLNEQGDYAAGRSYHEEALRIQKKVLGENHPSLSMTLNGLGISLRLLGDYQASRLAFEEALRIKERALGADNPAMAGISGNLMALEINVDNFQKAEELADQARRSAQRYVARVLPGMSDQEQLKFLETSELWAFHRPLSLALLKTDSPGLVARSASWVTNGKGVAQEALAARALLARDASNPKLAEKAQSLGSVRQRLASLALSVPKPEQELSRRESLDKLIADEQRLAREISAASGQSPNDQWVELETLRKAIPANAVFIDIVRFRVFDFQAQGLQKQWQPAHYVAWIIPSADKGEVQIVDLGPADTIDQAIEVVRQAIAQAGRADSTLHREGEVAAEVQTRKALAQIAALAWRPIAAKVGDARHLILSPDGALWLAPWSAMPVDEEQCILEKFALQYVISGRDLVRATATTLASTPPVIFADPDFDLTAQATQAAVGAVLPDLKPADDQTRGYIASQTALPRVLRLPNTELEAQAAKPSLKQLSGSDPVAYTGTYALESIAKRVQRPKMLVFSTHGFFLPDQELKADTSAGPSGDTRSAVLTTAGKPLENPLVRCGLLFAGCNSPQAAGSDDGILTGLEIVGLDLRSTELVVLSACETGIGKVQNGEGVAGLRQVFQLAGAKAVVSTLWQVPDRDSALIMNDFFANLAAGQTKAEALRNAQLKRIAERREKFGAAHPFFWAAWTVTGS